MKAPSGHELDELRREIVRRVGGAHNEGRRRRPRSGRVAFVLACEPSAPSELGDEQHRDAAR